MSQPEPISLKEVRTYSLKERVSKVDSSYFGRPWKAGGVMASFFETLPRVLAGRDLLEVAERIVKCAGAGGTVILGLGAHAVKVGLNPIILDLLERGILTGLAMNGAGIIHDAEIAMAGQTSEDVAAGIGSGLFGSAEETGRILNEAINDGAARGIGLGRAVGERLVQEKFPFNHQSLLARAHELDIPVTVHVAVGTDIVHFHPQADGASIGKGSHLDFRIFARLVSKLEGGVYINLGSAVILPEVFLKALSLVRNLGFHVRDFTTVNMDFIRHYRPTSNVVHRPTLEGGKGFSIIGHHEIMFPLLAAAVVEGLERDHLDKDASHPYIDGK